LPVKIIETLPDVSYLHEYSLRRAHTDGFYCDLAIEVTLTDFIASFYTTWLFKLERLVLAVLVAKPSTDQEAVALSRGERESFAAWRVEKKCHNQIIMCDYLSKTRSWLMCEPRGGGTRLYFGTIIEPSKIIDETRVDLGFFFHLLMPLHIIYSKALLKAACDKLSKQNLADCYPN
jgi:hypothetical protein